MKLAFAALLLAGACAADQPDPPAQFATADAAHLARAYRAASALDADAALALALSLTEAHDCPQLARRGNVVTVTGGCDGLEGSATFTNLASSGDHDPSWPTVLDFAGFSSSDIAIDGTVVIEPGYLELAVDETTDGIVAHDDERYLVDDDGTRHPMPGASLDVDGLGIATPSGAWQVAPASGTIAVTGVDTLIILQSDRDANGCFPTTIDGASGPPLC